MRGTESEQTKKTIKVVEELKQSFITVNWVLWDERLSSKRADEYKSAKRGSHEKLLSHARAAAFILSRT